MHIELLEDRRLLAATWSLSAGVLTIKGTNAAEKIVVAGDGQVAANINISVGNKIVLNKPLSNPALKKVVILGNGGDDIITVGVGVGLNTRAVTIPNLPGVPSTPGGVNLNIKPVPALVDGGAGNDIITTADGNDTVRGGEGNDNLAGSKGNDSLDGGAGDDTLWGGAGNDTLAGGLGSDRFYGEDGDDTIFAKDGVADGINGGKGTDKAVVDKTGQINDWLFDKLESVLTR